MSSSRGRSLLAIATLLAMSPGRAEAASARARETVTVTHSVLMALVKDLAGDRLDVRVAIPNGLDPHDWEPSARDVEALTRSALIVTNGLGLEGSMQRALAQARAAGVEVFTATEHLTVRRVGPGEGVPSGDPDQAPGAADPHIWTDPVAMKAVVRALAAQLRADLGVDLSDRLRVLEGRLDGLDAEIRRSVARVPPARRKLVTGHESLGYFAQRYGFQLVGAVVPGLSSQAESSAHGIAELKTLIARNQVRVLFTEVGTPPRLVESLARESGVRCVSLTTHALPADGSYFTFMRELAATVTDNLR